MEWKGRWAYPEALAAQQARREAVAEGTAEPVLWLLEHPPVVTLGRRGGTVDVLALAERGVPVVSTRRGGLATYHGPGQLVGYLIADAAARRWRVRDVVHGIEDGIVSWLASIGVEAAASCEHPGVWIDGAKVCAVGLHVRRGVTMHGFALNLDVELSGFDGIVPCGIAGAGVTSVARVSGRAWRPAGCAHEVGRHVLEAIVSRSVDGNR